MVFFYKKRKITDWLIRGDEVDIETVLQAYDAIGDHRFLQIIMYYKWILIPWILLMIGTIVLYWKKKTYGHSQLLQGVVLLPLCILGGWFAVLMAKGWGIDEIKWYEQYAKPYYDTLKVQEANIEEIEYFQAMAGRKSSFWEVTFYNQNSEKVEYIYDEGVTKMSDKGYAYVTYKEIDDRLGEKMGKEYPIVEFELYLTEEIYNQYKEK